MHTAHPQMINNNIIMQLKENESVDVESSQFRIRFHWATIHESCQVPSAKQKHQNDIKRITWKHISWSRQQNTIVLFNFIFI